MPKRYWVYLVMAVLGFMGVASFFVAAAVVWWQGAQEEQKIILKVGLLVVSCLAIGLFGLLKWMEPHHGGSWHPRSKK